MRHGGPVEAFKGGLGELMLRGAIWRILSNSLVSSA
jgi:hypothetical protein